MNADSDHFLAVDRFAKEVKSLEGRFGLERTATVLAAYAFPEVNPNRVVGTLDQIAFSAGKFSQDSFEVRVARINYALFTLERFSCAQTSFLSPAASMLHLGLETKRPSPCLLALIYHLVANRLEVPSWGVWSASGPHIALRDGDRILVVDPTRDGAMIGEYSLNETQTWEPEVRLAKVGKPMLSSVDRAVEWIIGMLSCLEQGLAEHGVSDDCQTVDLMRATLARRFS